MKFKVGEIYGILENIYNDKSLRQIVVPLFMSDTGMGKTTIIEQFMKDKGVYKPPLVLSQRMPFEISGMALVDKELDKMKYYDFDFLLDLKDDDILFIDETYNANPQTLSAFLTFLESRIMISGRKLPNIMIVAAANPQGMPVLTQQIRRRFLQYDVIFDKESWKKYMFKKHKVPYGKDNPIGDMLCKLIENEKFTGYNYNTPADLDKAVEMIIKNIRTPYEESLNSILNTFVEVPIDVFDGETLVFGKNQKVSWLTLRRKYETINK